MGDKRRYAEKISGVVLSFADETFISWRDCYIPDFWLDCCNWRVSCRTLRECTMCGNDMKCTILSIKLLTFVNEKFCSEMLVTNSLVRNDVVKAIMLNYEIINA